MNELGIEPHFTCCANCKHFYQHYTEDRNRVFIKVNLGHCGRRVRPTKPIGLCARFEWRDKDGQSR